jgi:hypothetical protein
MRASWWRRLFPRPEIRRAIALVGAFFDGFAPVQTDHVRVRAEKFLRGVDRLPPDITPEVAVMRLVATLAFDEVASGSAHIYRGTLSGRGIELVRLFDAAQKMRTRYGDPEAYELMLLTQRAQLQNAISDAG